MELSRVTLALLVTAGVANAEFFCSPIWGTTGRGPNNGNPRYRVSARTPADVAAMNARFAHLPNRGCHTNCNSTELRFIWFRYTTRSYPFIMDGTCPRSANGTNDPVYHLVDLDRMVGNGTDFRCGHHRGIGHDAGYYSIVEENCMAKIGTLNRFASTPSTSPPTMAPTMPPTAVPTNAPTDMPTYMPTASPTGAPTRHPCTNNQAGCDLSSTQCSILSANNFQCDCLPGFVTLPGSTTACQRAPTPAPTRMPTTSPTFNPTFFPTTQVPTPAPDPCATGTHQCDLTSTSCAVYSNPPYYTCLCNVGYEVDGNADPWTLRSCVATQSGSSGGSSGSSSDGLSASSTTGAVLIIVIIVVVVVIIGAVLYTQKSSSSGAAAPAAGFDNPMYADTTDVAHGESTTDGGADGYMDVDANDE